jgi:hypothetical protein
MTGNKTTAIKFTGSSLYNFLPATSMDYITCNDSLAISVSTGHSHLPGIQRSSWLYTAPPGHSHLYGLFISSSDPPGFKQPPQDTLTSADYLCPNYSHSYTSCSELSSGLYCHVKWLLTDVSEVHTASIITHPWWWRQYAPLKRWSTIILHGRITQKTTLNIILAAVRTWNLTQLYKFLPRHSHLTRLYNH